MGHNIVKVHLLATCRREELLPATTMVFNSIRIGFPTAEICVTYNNLSIPHALAVDKCVSAVGGERVTGMVADMIHHRWIQSLLESETSPFWLVDTDMVFWKSVEDWTFDAPMAGRFIPQFFDRFTNCITRPRLHTSLLYLDPVKIKSETDKYFAQFPDTPFNPKPNLINPTFQPVRDGDTVKNYFNDTCSLLYHAIGGQRFSNEQMEAFGHLGFGTISDVVSPHYPGFDLRMKAFVVFDNPDLLKGQWRVEDKFYADNAA